MGKRRSNCEEGRNCSGIKIAAVLLGIVALFLCLRLQNLQGGLRDAEEEKIRLTEEKQQLQDVIDDLTTEKGGIEEHGRLTVRGTRLYDASGNEVVLRGISSHGLTWYPEYTNYRSLKTIKEYGANIFRIAMYVDQNDGYIEEPELNRKLLYAAIENSLAADLYTIVDWHVLRDENPNSHIDKAMKAFEEIAGRYGNEPGIIYEICNEPNGDTTYEDIVQYAGKIIPVIRKYAPDALILVGTPNFCTSLSEAIENPLDFENIMYTYHYYAGVSDCEFAIEEIGRGLESGLPVFVSEWGMDSYNATKENWNDTESFLSFLDQNGIGWINWSLSNKEEGYSLLRKDTVKLNGWENDDFSDIGRFVVNRLSDK